MDCLQNYIGLKQCSETEPESGYYLNDLPGISTELAHRIADQEQLNFAGVWNSVQKRAARKFGQLVQRFINHRQNWKEILYQTPGYKITTPLLFTANSNVSATVELPEGKYVEGYLKSVLVYSQSAVSGVTLTITDTFGNTLHTVPDIALKAGLNRVKVGYTVASEESGLGFTVTLTSPEAEPETDPVLLSLAPITLNSIATSEDCNTCSGIVQKNGLLIPELDIKCSINRYICENINLFAYSLWYLHGAELLAEKLTSPRTTYFSTSNLEYTRNLQQEFYNEFETSAMQALKAIDLKGLCIACKEDNPGQLSYGSMLA